MLFGKTIIGLVRNVFHLFQKVWHQLDGSVKWKRGLGKLFRMHAWNLSDDQTAKLISYLALNPAIEAVYEKRNEICRLLIRKNQRGFQMRKNVGKLLAIIQELKESGFGPLKTLADTLESWAAEIGRMWRSSKSNGPVEGFHNKMEVISRRAYGYRNFKNYRRRVLAMSGWDGVLTRRTVAYTKMPWMRTRNQKPLCKSKIQTARESALPEMLAVGYIAKNQENRSFNIDWSPQPVQKDKTEGLQNERKKGIEKAVQPNGIQGACAPLDRVEPTTVLNGGGGATVVEHLSVGEVYPVSWKRKVKNQSGD